MSDRVPAAPVRDALDRYLRESGRSLSRVAEDLGFTRVVRSGRQVGIVRADTSGLKRAVGLMPRFTKGRVYKGHSYGHYGHTNQTVDYDLAVRIALLIGADPVELGV